MADLQTNTFRDLICELSHFYKGDQYKLLRFILFNHLSLGDITNSDFIGNDLFNALEQEGLITPSNVNLLLEITQLSEVKKAEELVQQYMNDKKTQNTAIPNWKLAQQNYVNKTSLSLYRRKLFKAIVNTTEQDFMHIISYYNLGLYRFRDMWDTVLKLEIEDQLTDDPGKIRRFAKLLNSVARAILMDDMKVSLKYKDDSPSSSHGMQPAGEVLSVDNFNELIVEFAKWCDARGLLNKLQVLYIDMLGEVGALESVTNTKGLLDLLTTSGLLSNSDISVLFDTLMVTKQFGLKSTIEEKFRFRWPKDRAVVSFSSHRITIFNLGNSLTHSDINTLDGRYNFPFLKRYTDSWSLILDFERRGLLQDDKLEKVLKRYNIDFDFVV